MFMPGFWGWAMSHVGAAINTGELDQKLREPIQYSQVQKKIFWKKKNPCWNDISRSKTRFYQIKRKKSNFEMLCLISKHRKLVLSSVSKRKFTLKFSQNVYLCWFDICFEELERWWRTLALRTK